MSVVYKPLSHPVFGYNSMVFGYSSPDGLREKFTLSMLQDLKC